MRLFSFKSQFVTCQVVDKKEAYFEMSSFIYDQSVNCWSFLPMGYGKHTQAQSTSKEQEAASDCTIVLEVRDGTETCNRVTKVQI